jgi:hypothetical protein
MMALFETRPAVREQGSRLRTTEYPDTPPELPGTRLCASSPLRTQCVEQVNPVEPLNGSCWNPSPSGMGFLCIWKSIPYLSQKRFVNRPSYPFEMIGCVVVCCCYAATHHDTAQWGAPSCKLRVQIGRTCTRPRTNPCWWGMYIFRCSRKIYIPHSRGEREGTCFPHTPHPDGEFEELLPLKLPPERLCPGYPVPMARKLLFLQPEEVAEKSST